MPRVRGTAVSNEEISDLRMRVADEQDAIGRAHALARSSAPRGEREVRDLRRELVATGDPHVIRWSRSTCIGAAPSKPTCRPGTGRCATWDSTATRKATWGLRLASPAIANGTASTRPARAFSPAGERVSRERKEQIVAALRNRDWKTLGL
jgi:hypothetical protein